MSENREVMTGDFLENRADDIEDARLYNHSQPYKDMALALEDCRYALRISRAMLSAVTAPFDCAINIPLEVHNPERKGETVTIKPVALAVYDAIKEAEYKLSGQGLSRGETMAYQVRYNKGITWFRKYYPKEYSALLEGVS